MRYLKSILITFITVTSFCYDQPATPANFQFVKLVDKTPYIVITSPTILADVLNSLQVAEIAAEQDKESFGEPRYSLDSTRIQLPEELYLFYGFSYHFRYARKIVEVPRDGYSLALSSYIMQYAFPDGRSKQIILKGHSAWYLPSAHAGYVLIECEPIKEELPQFEVKMQYLHSAIPVGKQFTYWQQGIPQEPLPEIPQSIREWVDVLSNQFLQSLENYRKYGESVEGPTARRPITALRWFNGTKSEVYYAAIASYGSKDYKSTLWLLDSTGNVIQQKVGTRYINIIGKTDLNRDGTHELTVLFSHGGYNGGIELLNLEDIGAKHPVLKSVAAQDTFFD